MPRSGMRIERGGLSLADSMIVLVGLAVARTGHCTALGLAEAPSDPLFSCKLLPPETCDHLISYYFIRMIKINV